LHVAPGSLHVGKISYGESSSGSLVQVGRRIDEQSPLVDARLGGRLAGERRSFLPSRLGGSKLTIRKFSRKRYSVDDLIRFGSLSRQMSEFSPGLPSMPARTSSFREARESGKTTLLNILSSFIPERRTDRDDRGLGRSCNYPSLTSYAWETRPVNIEGQGGDLDPRSGEELAAHAARPDRDRRMPRSRSTRTCSRP